MRFLWRDLLKASSAIVLASTLLATSFNGAIAAMPGVADAVILSDAYSDSQSTITLVWDVPADNGTPITGFAVLARQGVAPFALVSDEVLASDPLATTFTLTGLEAGTAYDLQVAALSAAGDYSDLSTFNFSDVANLTTAADVPGKPAAPNPTASTTSSITVAWLPPAKTNGSAIVDYVLGFRAVGASTFATTTLASLFANYTFSGLQPDTEYEINLTAENAIGAGPTSDVAVVRTDSDSAVEPDPVVLTSADATVAGAASNVTLRWSAPNNGGSTITGYAVQFKAAADAGWSDSNLVIASNATSVTFDASQVVAESALAEAINLGLKQDPNYVMSPADQATFIAAAKSTFSLASYSFQIAALNNVASLSNLANYSSPIVFSLPVALNISSVSSITTSSAALVWAAPTGLSSLVVGYAVRYRAKGAVDWVSFGSTIVATSVTVSSLSPATEYEFQVAAINGLGQGAFGATASGTTLAGLVTAAPDAVVVSSTSATGSSVTLNFSAPAAHNSAITGYAISYRVVGAGSWTNGSNLASAATTATVSSLSPGTNYEFKIAALNGVATSGATANWMSPVAVSTLAFAVAPVITASSATATSAQLTWNASANNGGSSVTGYSFGYRAVGAGAWTFVALGNVLTYQVTGLLSSTAYEFEVAAVNAAGTGSYSTATQLTTSAPPVAKPTPVTILFALNSAKLTAATQKAIKAWAAKVSKTTTITLDGYAAPTTVKKVKADSGLVALAKARATAIATYLKSLGWVSSKVIGHGGATPASKTDPNKNRRVVLSVK